MIVEDVLWWIPAHNCLVCVQCVDGSIINYSNLITHMRTHSIRVDARFNQNLSAVSRTLSFATAEELYKELKEKTDNTPIPGLRIHEGYRCCDCPYASISLGSMRTHKSKPSKDSPPHHKYELKPARVQQLAQRHNAPLFVVKVPSTPFLCFFVLALVYVI